MLVASFLSRKVMKIITIFPEANGKVYLGTITRY